VYHHRLSMPGGYRQQLPQHVLLSVLIGQRPDPLVVVQPYFADADNLSYVVFFKCRSRSMSALEMFQDAGRARITKVLYSGASSALFDWKRNPATRQWQPACCRALSIVSGYSLSLRWACVLKLVHR
jgi:hypothetical protein